MKISLKELAIAAVLTAVTCVLAPISIPIGPVPISLGVLCILLIGAILPPQLAVLSTLVYILIGTVGIPVFSNYEGGFQKLIGPTGGFLFAYPLMVLIISFSAVLFKRKNVFSICFGMILSLILMYALGTFWFVISTKSTVKNALLVCVIPFILVDLLKMVCATALSTAINKALLKANVKV